MANGYPNRCAALAALALLIASPAFAGNGGGGPDERGGHGPGAEDGRGHEGRPDGDFRPRRSDREDLPRHDRPAERVLERILDEILDAERDRHGRRVLRGDMIDPRDAERAYGAGMPRGHLPPPGECRDWIPGVPPGQQPPPYRC